MKYKYAWAITILIMIIIGIFMYFHLNGSGTYEKIDIYTATNFDKSVNTPILSINDKKILKEISIIFKESEKIPGILDVAPSDYILKIYRNNKSVQTVDLWINKDSIRGMYIYRDNTETGYTISKMDTDKLKKIILTTIK